MEDNSTKEMENNDKKIKEEIIFNIYLTEACKTGDLKKIGMLIDKYNMVPYHIGFEALLEAARIGNLDVVKFLIENGVQPPHQGDLAMLIIALNFVHDYNDNHTKIIDYLKLLNIKSA